MKSWIRRILLELLSWLASISVFLSSRGRWRAWQRNSLALGYWSEGSDLDLTLFSATNAPLPSTTLRMWKLFRRFGEWSAYCQSDIQWAHLINPLELARDPKLARVFADRPREATRAEAAVFWMRMMSSGSGWDADEEKSRSRRRKWEFHRRQVGELVSPLEFPHFVSATKDILVPPVGADIARWEAAMRPHLWVEAAIFVRIPLKEHLASLPLPVLEHARAQTRWEMWGGLGQARLRRNAAEVARHLFHLTELLPGNDPLRSVMAEFRSYLLNEV